VASFTYTCSGFACSFDGASSTGATSYAWNFGDGGTASGETASHTFGARQKYTVVLTINAGAASTSRVVNCNPVRCN